MALEGDTTLCENCQRNIPTSSYTTHTVHCTRFVELCQKCRSPIPKSGMQAHVEEVHAAMDCKVCNSPVEKGAINDHQANDCPGRIIACRHCSVGCAVLKLDEHEKACGSRTHQCDVCKNFVLVKMLAAHLELHPVSPSKPTPPQFHENVSRNEPSLQSVHNGEGHEQEAQNKVFSRERHTVEGSSTDEEDYWSMYPGASRRGELQQRSSPKQRSTVRDADEEADYWSQYATALSAPPTHRIQQTDDEDEPSISCEICDLPFPLSCLELHQISCQFSELMSTDEVHGERRLAHQLTVPQHVTCSICDVIISSDIRGIHEGCQRISALPKQNKPVTRSPKKLLPINPPRAETSDQRAVRESVLLATEARRGTNRQISQSKLHVVQLPDGREVLKKRHPDEGEFGNVDSGRVLGRGRRAASETSDGDTFQIPRRLQGGFDRIEVTDITASRAHRGTELGTRPKRSRD